MIGFLLNNKLAPIGSSVISTCSPADLFEQRERNVPLASAVVCRGGILREEPKERLRRRLADLGTRCRRTFPPPFFFSQWSTKGSSIHSLPLWEGKGSLLSLPSLINSLIIRQVCIANINQGRWVQRAGMDRAGTRRTFLYTLILLYLCL